MMSRRRWASASPSLVDHVRLILQNKAKVQPATAARTGPSLATAKPVAAPSNLRRLVISNDDAGPRLQTPPSLQKGDSVLTFFDALYDMKSAKTQIKTREQRAHDAQQRKKDYEERVARRSRAKFVRQDRPERTRKVFLTEGVKVTIRDASIMLMVPIPKLVGALRRSGEKIPRRGSQAELTVSTEALQLAALDLDLSFEIVLRPADIDKDDERFVESQYVEAGGEVSCWPKRPIVISIVGHVNHGKTTLLDALRSSQVASSEFGGITQRIGAFALQLAEGVNATVLDTPGHGAFTTMRANACRLTDVVVLAVAADASVQDQTLASIRTILAENVPVVVAITKSDLVTADIDQVKRDLRKHGIICESMGGDVPMVPVSSTTKQGLDTLREAIALVGEMTEPAAPIDGPARAVVIDSHVERGRGTMVSALVRRGTLKVGDVVLAGSHFGVVKSMYDDYGRSVSTATPSQAVQLCGLKENPEAGYGMVVVDTEQRARRMASRRAWLQQQEQLANSQLWKPAEPEDPLECDEPEHVKPKCLRLIIRSDMSGSLTAVSEFISSLPQDQVHIQVMSQAIGNITQHDLDVAKQSGATIFGFNVTLPASLKRLAKDLDVEIKTQKIIYKIMDEIVDCVNRLMPSIQVSESLGRAEIATVFELRGNRSKIANRVAGCRVVAGKIMRSALVRLIRSGETIWEGTIDSLKHLKDNVPVAEKGSECGISLENFQEIQQGDIIECFQTNLVQEKVVVKPPGYVNK